MKTMSDEIQCKYCQQKIESENYRVLLDGTRLHLKCFEYIANPGKEFESKIENIQQSINEVRRQLYIELNSRSYFKKLFSIQTDRSNELQTEYDRLISHHKRLLDESSIFNFKKLTEFEEYYDYWPHRPLDWETRSRSIRNKIGQCEKCYRKETKKRKLHAHHKIPISQGGNHLESNLKVLCNYCHRKEHSHRFGKFKSDVTNKSFQKKIARVEKAIQNGKKLTFEYNNGRQPVEEITIIPLNITYVNGVSVRGIDDELGKKKIYALKRMAFKKLKGRDESQDNVALIKKAMREDRLIHCTYRNYEGIVSERTIKPLNFSKFQNTMVVECYDYLRKTKRSFRPSRMIDLEIVDQPGKQKRKS
ncbi:MAG: WYL domain-containing protein [Balneolaceae bacterium]|nr:WYL domain-containing protein [Balneolaceae bacterium]